MVWVCGAWIRTWIRAWIMFYDQKHTAHLAACFGPPAGSQQANRSTCICETRLFITLEGPEDRHLRNSICGGHVTSLTHQYLWSRPPGLSWISVKVGVGWRVKPPWSPRGGHDSAEMQRPVIMSTALSPMGDNGTIHELLWTSGKKVVSFPSVRTLTEDNFIIWCRN